MPPFPSFWLGDSGARLHAGESMSIIDNRKNTMQDALIKDIALADRVDIAVAFFYFSGWKLLARHLKDKKVRIFVGSYIDPKAIPEMLLWTKQAGADIDLDRYQPRQPPISRTARKQAYLEGMIALSNSSALFDDSANREAYKILENKIANGTLAIRLGHFSSNKEKEHGKFYIIHNKQESSDETSRLGVVFMGSSNFTFQGLVNQGEVNDRFSSKETYAEYIKKFEELWNSGETIDIATQDNKDELLTKLKKELWIYATPTPYEIYIRVLHELFGKESATKIKTPSQITNGRYMDLAYQTDAIQSVLTKLERYHGAILADVVGLGKSIIASAVGTNLGLNTIIIAPPHLKEQWTNYQEEFRLPGARVFSAGTIKDVYKRYKDSRNPLLIIIDEAHRYRNEDTNDYRKLHQVCHGNPKNKILLLTATPFNNDPKDVFALVKLFQIPGVSDIKSVDNLSLRFRELIERYKKLHRTRRKGIKNQEYLNEEADAISSELRRLVENVVIRRSRIDLKIITRYREDLERNNIDFAEVAGPTIIKYELGELLNLYAETLAKITGDVSEGGFIGARYKPIAYIRDKEKFLKEYGDLDIKTAQTNLAKFMKRLLVMRFESSKEAFKSTLKTIIASNKLVEDWWDILGKVPILKKGQVPDPDSIVQSSADDVDKEVLQQVAEKELRELRETKGLLSVDRSLIDNSFIEDVRKDRKLLERIYADWFGETARSDISFDPKLERVYKKIVTLLAENRDRKIVIFSAYADTVNYLAKALKRKGLEKVFKYTSADGNKTTKEVIRANFDAGLRESEQLDDYQVLVATDALSEGFNLHRAGIVINYDIPYNPTRVIQRIGRINRINKKVFDKIYIYNCFPTDTGESEVRVKQIATLKMRLINAVVGSDTKTLTDDEKLESFFKDDFRKAEQDGEYQSWDAVYREDYNQACLNNNVKVNALAIKPRSRVVRTGKSLSALVAFGKKGDHLVFGLKEGEGEVNIVSSERALSYFRATPSEKGKSADRHYDEVFNLVRDTLFAKSPLPAIRGRRSKALDVVKLIEEKLPKAKDYCRDLAQVIKKYDGINEGDLKSIGSISVAFPERAFAQLQDIAPSASIASIIERATQSEREQETILLSEDIRK